MDGLVEKHQKELKEIADQLPQLKVLLDKPFEKETELQQMKSELSKLEQQIAQKIHEKQEAQKRCDQTSIDTTVIGRDTEPGGNDAQVIEMHPAGKKVSFEQGVVQRDQLTETIRKTKGVRL